MLPRRQLKDNQYSEAAIRSYRIVLNFLPKSLKDTSERLHSVSVGGYITAISLKRNSFADIFQVICF